MQNEGDIRMHTLATSKGSDPLFYSDMQFIDFGADNCFRIEDSHFYKKSLQHMGYKTVEFVTYKSPNESGEGSLYFVEAKTSLRPCINTERAANEIADIAQKFIDALQIVCGAWHGDRQHKVSLPINFQAFKISGSKIVFVLVVKHSENKNFLWVADAIERELKREMRLWKFTVKVLSEELAIKEKLVIPSDT